MSDEFEQDKENLGLALARVYRLIAKVVSKLPIPIALPGGPVYDSTEIVPATIRVTEIIEEQPIPQDLQVLIWGGCLHWIAAAHLFDRWLKTQEHVTTLEVQINLVAAGDAIIDAAAELMLMIDELDE
ncbi:hypothetical protein ACGFRG_07945 [Streptomyces sp. NPDC048696]|uniref:hypothetical protein n=1 Tax=Streptomyces sp. NPDC048696 TaxID=3365585 RepID=UPI003723073B